MILILKKQRGMIEGVLNVDNAYIFFTLFFMMFVLIIDHADVLILHLFMDVPILDTLHVPTYRISRTI